MAALSVQTKLAQLPRFGDYRVSLYAGKVVPPQFGDAAQYDGVDIRCFGLTKSEGREQGGQGLNFAGNMIVVQWSGAAPGMEMAVVVAETGEVYFPPISFHGIRAASFDLHY